jgi:hypothetical protein
MNYLTRQNGITSTGKFRENTFFPAPVPCSVMSPSYKTRRRMRQHVEILHSMLKN